MIDGKIKSIQCQKIEKNRVYYPVDDWIGLQKQNVTRIVSR